MSMSNNEQNRSHNPLEQLFNTAQFLGRQLVKRANQELIKGGSVVEDVGKSIERSREVGEDIVNRIGQLLAKHPTGEDRALTIDETDSREELSFKLAIELGEDTILDLRPPLTPEQEAELEHSVQMHPASRFKD